MAAERSKGTDDEVFAGDRDGAPKNGPRESGGGAGETTELAGKQYRSSMTDNPGSAPYLGGADAGKGNTNQDDRGDAALYAEPSATGTTGEEHQESAADQDVDGYYRSLSERRPPNYSKNANLQVKQSPLELAPVDGGDGFVGSNTGPAVNFNYITGKKGYSEDVPVWEEKSSFTEYRDNSGSADMDDDSVTHAEDSRDEFAPWKHVKTDKGFPQTAFSDVKEGGASSDNEGSNEGGNPDTQPIPSADSGDKDSSDMPKTEFTDNDGGGAPLFKFSGQTPPKSLYMPKPRE